MASCSNSDYMHKDIAVNLMILSNVMTSVPKAVKDYIERISFTVNKLTDITHFLRIVQKASEMRAEISLNRTEILLRPHL